MARDLEVRLSGLHAAQEAEPGAAAAAPSVVAVTAERPQISDLAQFLRHARTVLPSAVVGVFVLTLVAFLFFAKPVVMPLVVALLLTFVLKPLVNVLAGAGVPRIIGAVIVIVTFIGLLTFGATRVLQPAAEWAARAPETVGVIQQKFEHVFRGARRITQAAAEVEHITSAGPADGTAQVEVRESALIKTLFAYTKGFVAGSIEVVVLLFFMLAPGNLYMEKLVRVLPTLHDKKKAVEIANEVHYNLSAFLLTITLINTALGFLVGLSCWAIGLPNPALWGVLAGCLNFIPYFGPITGVLVLLVVGFVTFDSPLRSLLPSMTYLLIHAVESNVITPMILGRRLTLNPLVIFISLMFWTWLWGIPGALLSIPMLMMFKIFCDHFRPLAPVGEFLSE